ncbi:hypothetical protein [Empedobacter sp. UBA6322]|uniref:hypothetical protein n=1 Tax=Empedobacter sp. UBA6322 TaxID=1946446 RepID=UPI0025BC2E71|nr:hypothetical protein [Empedobacter sp. UBA6322]
MKIVNIFANRLFALHYQNETYNEYDRLMDLWDDTTYIYDFLKENVADIPKGKNIKDIAEDIIEDAYAIEDTLLEITETSDKTLSQFFKPLYNQEYQLKVLSLQKGREDYLRIYAIRIDDDTFVITGGAIKLPLHYLMDDRPHTRFELQKLENVKAFLNENGIFDDDSFFEFLNEN